MFFCSNDQEFRKYFNENMKELGLPVPKTLFDNFTAAVATASVMLEALGSLGARATMTELAGATAQLEKLKVLGALAASFYVGAVIGSLAVASGRYLGCGSRISDLFALQKQYKLQFQGSTQFYALHPEILNPQRANRKHFATKAKEAV